MRRLTIGNRIWGLLKANDLSVRELASVVDERHRTHGSTDVTRAAGRFVDLATVDFDLDGVRAGETTEEGSFHVGDDGRGADDETFDADEFVRVCAMM